MAFAWLTYWLTKKSYGNTVFAYQLVSYLV